MAGAAGAGGSPTGGVLAAARPVSVRRGPFGASSPAADGGGPRGGDRRTKSARVVRRAVAGLLALAAIWLVPVVYNHDRLGPIYAFMLTGGVAFGVLLQRTRFCLFCIFKDFYLFRNAKPLLAVLATIAIGSIGYLAIFESWIPDPGQGWLPPQAHIGPVGWHLVAGGLLFGVGMALSGSCISSHLYRLGEGSGIAVPSLLGAAVGFGLGFASWNTVYLRFVQSAPVVWLPASAGYGGAALIHAAILAGLAALLLVLHRRRPATHPRPIESVGDALRRFLTEKWKPIAGAIGIGILAFLIYFKVEPLGVTAELGRLSRNAFTGFGLAPDRLEGLDTLAGCSTADTGELLTTNAVFIAALVGGSLVSALAGGYFRFRMPKAGEAIRGFGGGILLGFGAMISLGCSIGTFLSGTMALSVSGWVFGVFMAAGIWIGLKLIGREAAQKSGCSAPPVDAAAHRTATHATGAVTVGVADRARQDATTGPTAASIDAAEGGAGVAVADGWTADGIAGGVVSAAQLAALPDVQIVETGRTAEEFEAGHLPGARFFAWDAIWRRINGIEGKLPSPPEVAREVAALGFDPDRPVVLYDDHGGARCCRLLLVLEMLGFTQLALLDGGLLGWAGADLALESGKSAPLVGPRAGAPRAIAVPQRWDRIIDLDDLARRLGRLDILDTRTREEFDGRDVRAARAGHIPGSRNIDWQTNIDPTTRLLKPHAELARLYDDYLDSDTPLVLTCQSGRRSCQTWYVLRLLGREKNVFIYDGSWTEWGNRDDLPIEGPAPG